MSNVTKDGIEVAEGQIWRDLDKRMGGRALKVMRVADGYAFLQGLNGRRETRIAIARMHKHSTGWEFVK